MSRLVFWLLLLAGTGWILWAYRRRLRVALRLLMILYPVLLILSIIQSGFDTDRLFLLVAMLAVGVTVFAINRKLGRER